MIRRALRLAAVLATVALVTCTNPMLTTVEQVVQVYNTALYRLNFANGEGIAPTSTIRIVFSKSMNPATMELSGEMAAESDGGVWSTTNNPNDTLSLSPRPNSTWALGDQRTLSVIVDDLETYTAEPAHLVYGVLDGVVYAHAGRGNDLNPGTAELPKKTIQAAINTAEAAYDEAEVWVAEGLYPIYRSITIRKSIRLRGGYSHDSWTDRDELTWALEDNAQYPTVIQYMVHTAVQIEEHATGFLVEGFSIEKLGSASGDSRLYVGIDVDSASGTVRSCRVDGGWQGTEFCAAVMVKGSNLLIDRSYLYGGTLTPSSYGIIASQAGLHVVNSVVHAGSGHHVGGDSWTRGIAITGTTATIERSLVYGGGGSLMSYALRSTMQSETTVINTIVKGGAVNHGLFVYGIYSRDSVLVARNCVISGGSSSFSSSMSFKAVTLSGDTEATIENNIVFVGPVSGSPFRRRGIEADPVMSTLGSLRNNTIYDCPDGLFVWVQDPSVVYDDIELVNSDLDFASGNVSLSAHFAGQSVDDYRLTGTTPVEVREEGIDGAAAGWGYNTDRDGLPRIGDGELGWSMGAHEYQEP